MGATLGGAPSSAVNGLLAGAHLCSFGLFFSRTAKQSTLDVLSFEGAKALGWLLLPLLLPSPLTAWKFSEA